MSANIDIAFEYLEAVPQVWAVDTTVMLTPGPFSGEWTITGVDFEAEVVTLGEFIGSRGGAVREGAPNG